MTAKTVTENTGASPGGPFAPLRERTFRTIWSASLLSNFGQLILGVGAAWEMTRLASSPSMVALVQTAMMLPLMLVALPAGAIADMFDRRKIALTGLGFACLSAVLLSILAMLGWVTPWVLLGFCVLIGSGVALYGPAWQASISEQVEPAHLPAAVALGTISYNVARSFGPAIGGLIVLAAGAKAAFATNAICYIPLFVAFLLWKRRKLPSRLPPERFDRAIFAGGRYAAMSPPIRHVLIRALAFGLAGAASAALAPLIVRTLLGGDAATYGIFLGASGVGAVGGALLVAPARARYSTETVVCALSVLSGAALFALGLSHNIWLSCALYFILGGANILTIALMNVAVQLAAPRWVTARALSLFTSALTGGFAFGAWGWGAVASATSVGVAVMGSGIALALVPLLGLLWPLPRDAHGSVEQVEIDEEPEVAMALTLRSGPIVIEIDYSVDPDQARPFYDAMLKVQKARIRNGAFGWSIARDIADTSLWTERYECPTWGDYLRMRARFTKADVEAQDEAEAYNALRGQGRVRRRLERPFGSVRWRADSPDPHQTEIGYVMP